VQTWQVALGAAITACSLLYVGRLASDAIKEEERMADAEQEQQQHSSDSGKDA
jgi:hypothetical protein